MQLSTATHTSGCWLRPFYPTDHLRAGLPSLRRAPELPPPCGITLSEDINDPNFDTPLHVDTHRAAYTSLGASTGRRPESELTLHPVMHLARVLPPAAHSSQLDIGFNYMLYCHIIGPC
jgi:hypothetical protein